MKLPDVIFIGFNRRVAALHRLTGQIIWEWKAPKGSCYVSLLLERDLLVVSVDGYIYGIDPLTGGQLWSNPMTGYGTGVTSLVSVNGISSGQLNLAVSEITARQAASSSGSDAGSGH
ncbi:PQQ-binding-like beta-propeller repeat protein [Luteolibacter yonseiensis]|uniref:PQQ-binding-like beta-propeller repeat protein n=1 Tax=Luteolibacter yonseiensis TaxID=1144680 RepID=A0A934R3M6_9BACT|nr:PQQ-binding-like beta-propeller repeat protein [Luteolibacter yonseiensis]MBK1816237.1 PQQ-binding-like beta-propeller repeat protein [Luteolibacter yonseiensis]